MTNATVKQILIDLITDQLSVVTDDDFEQLGRKKYKEPVLKLTIFPHLVKGSTNYETLESFQVLNVCKKLKSENQIIDCGFVHNFEKPDENTKDLSGVYWFGVVVILTKGQVNLFNKSTVPLFDPNSGILEYLGRTVKFTKTSKQYSFIKALHEKQGKIVALSELTELFWPGVPNLTPALKRNFYDVPRKIRKKLQKFSISEDIFLETNNGYGLRDK